MLGIIESITVTDAAVPQPSAMLLVTESVTVTDAPSTVVVGNTPLGTDVSLTPVDAGTGRTPVTLRFNTVTQPGQTVLVIGATGPPPPPGFERGNPPQYYDLSTTAAFTGNVEVCVRYAGTTFGGAPTLWHFENAGWVNITVRHDPAQQETCGSALSLSPFALFAPVDQLPADGRMHGAGHIDHGRTRHSFAFQVAQSSKKERGQLEYRVHDPRQKLVGRFDAKSITDVTFSDDPGFRPRRGSQDRKPSIDTVSFSGTGKWNGKSGYTFEAIATDQGEPGRGRDTFSLIVRNSSGSVVADVSGALDGGNIQSTRLRR